jgi:phosphate transport system permease protein
MASAELLAPAPGAPPSAPPPGQTVTRAPRERTGSWPLADRIGFWLAWAVGIALCLISLGIVVFMFLKGISYLKPSMLVTSPAPEIQQSRSGGFLDPIEGTLIVAAVGIAIAAPLGIALAVWLSEYGRPTWLARSVESAVEMMSGVPSVVLALFALLVFAQSFLGFLSTTAADGAVYARSFFAAGAAMAVLALPLIVTSTREGLNQLPGRLREASYALGRTRITTIRRVLLPAIRPEMASGVVLGLGRIIGDTAIITIVLGGTLQLEGVGNTPVLGTLRGTGSTLTSYVYLNSPAGEGSAPDKAYAAAFVLLLIVLLLNALVTFIANRGSEQDPGLSSRLLALRWLPWTR